MKYSFGTLPIAISSLWLMSGCTSFNPPSDTLREAQRPDELRNALPAVTASIEKQPHILGNAAGGTLSRDSRAQHNRIALDYFRRVEGPHYQTRERSDTFRTALGLLRQAWPDDLPRSCLALSAGGIRSAAVGVGVLHALESNGILTGVDAISAASGGAYTLSWFYAQQHFDRIDAAKLLALDGEHVKFLGSRAPNFIDSAGLISTLVTWPFQLLMGAFSILPGTTQVDMGGIGYYVALSRMWYDSPLNEADIRRMSLEEVGSLVEARKLPIPIFAATRTHRKCSYSDNTPWPVSVFEITPWHAGADTTGYSDYFQDEELAGATMISGAALDKPSALNCSVARFLGMQTGVTINGMHTVALGGREVRESVHLIDAGFSDALGAYPLLKRACQTIVIIDAADDPDLTFTSYERLKQRAEEDLGLKVSLPTVDDYLAWRPGGETCLSSSAGFRSKHLRLRCAVSRGTVSSLAIDSDSTDLSLDLIYVKLSIDEAVMSTANESHAYPAEVSNFYRSDTREDCEGSGLSHRCPFPQQSSYTQRMSPEEFRAYVHLGSFLMERGITSSATSNRSHE